MLIASIKLSAAQNTAGIIKDESGNPLHFVFINDQYNSAAFSDSSGNFSLATHPDSRLRFNLAGYKDTSATVVQNANLQVVLMSNGSVSLQGTIAAQQATQNTSENSTFGTGGYLAPTHQTGATHGSQYLFPTFVHGFVITAADKLAHSANYLFDYDKMGGILLLTKDNRTMTTVGNDDTKSFTLFGNDDQRLTFVKVPAIDNAHWVQVLASGSKYAIYKVIKTTFVKANFENHGVTQTGNDYDEYADDFNYYIYDVAGNSYKKTALKKKALKEDFPKEADKITKYISDHSSESIDDTYLEKLGIFMNN